MERKSYKGTCCLVCGFDFEEPLHPDDDCPCCGIVIGYCMPDDDPKHIEDNRRIWLEKENAAWGDGEKNQPKGWNKEMALAQIKANVPPEFQ